MIEMLAGAFLTLAFAVHIARQASESEPVPVQADE